MGLEIYGLTCKTCKHYKQIPFTSLADCWKHKMCFNIHRDDLRVCNDYKKKRKRNKQ